ncbi:hypothetical protein ACFE04_025749 [Oxalis oulophora]
MDFKHIAIAIRHCGHIRAFKHGKSIHSHLIKQGCFQNVFIANNLMSMYVDFKLLGDAQKLFDEMPHRNVVTWTSLISAQTSNGRPDEALRLYNEMVESEFESPNGFVYSAALKACGLVGDIELGRSIHKIICIDKLEDDTVLMNTLLDMYVKCGSLSYAQKVFDEIPCANKTSWNTIIDGYCKKGLMEDAVESFNRMPQRNVVSWNSIVAGFTDIGSSRSLEFVHKMHKEGYKLDEFTFPCALKTCSFLGSLARGKQIHCYLIKSGFESQSFTISALVDMYSSCYSLEDAMKLFNHYSNCDTFVHDNPALWNSMLSGCVVNERNETAIRLLSHIHHFTYVNSYTLSSALKLCINLLSLRLGLQVHGLVVTSGYELDYIVGSVLIDLYSRLGNIKDAVSLFHRLPEKDTVAWAGLIIGCAKVGLGSLALSIFMDMIIMNLEVDQFVISTILKECSKFSSLISGKQVHTFCIKTGYASEWVIVTSLLDFYSKCGQIEDSLSLFDSTLDRDVVSWTSIIVGCGQNGKVTEAIQYFHEMIQSGLKPNEVTYLGVLSACRHAGFVEQAWMIFNLMRYEHGLEPQLEHYYCIIDLLGQAGRFMEVEELITNMPLEPDKTIWSSLLGACGTHKNINLVKSIAERLLKNSPNDPSIYVMLSNAYATLEMWEHLNEMRKTAKQLGIKAPGKSWIEI